MDDNRKDLEKLEHMKQQYEQINMSKEQLEQMKNKIAKAKQEKLIAQSKQNRKKRPVIAKIGIAAAAAAAAFLIIPNVSKEAAYAMSQLPIVGGLVEVVTFRDYQYDDERHQANVNVPELVPSQAETATGTETQQSENPEVQENLKKTTDEINQEIQKITDQIIAEFEENAKNQEGYQNIMIDHEILTTSEKYFTLKLICYQASGSGAEWDYFYTIDLTTGQRLALADLFTEGADYITPISDSIKEQMQARMDADENVYYWLNDEIEEWNFKQITDDTSFYLNADNHIVISFNEGDVAPMYMGCVEFEIPDEAVAQIRR